MSVLQCENVDLLRSLVLEVIQDHTDFRRYKYFPLDPEYVTPSIKQHETFREAEQNLRTHLKALSKRLKNSVPFSSFRSQVTELSFYVSIF